MNDDVFKGTPNLETKRLILRKLTLEDAEDVFDYAKNPIVSKYLTWEAHKSIDDAINYIQFVLDKYDSFAAGEWGITLKSSGKLIGALGFVNFDKPNLCGEIGYAISDNYWNQGIMTEALKRVIRFAFEETDFNRVQALHAVENPASGKVMQKANMSYEGLIKQRIYAKERFWDAKQYAIVKSDWASVDKD